MEQMSNLGALSRARKQKVKSARKIPAPAVSRVNFQGCVPPHTHTHCKEKVTKFGSFGFWYKFGPPKIDFSNSK